MSTPENRLSLPKQLKYLISASLLIAAFVLSVMLVSMKESATDRESVDLTPLVSVRPAKPFAGKLGIEVSGMVVPHKEIRIASQVNGRVSKREERASAGNFVNAGDVLLTIDDEDYRLQIDRIKAEVAQAENSIVELDEELAGLGNSLKIAEEDLKLQNDELDRRKSLGAALSQSEFDQAKRSVMASERVVTELQNAVRQAKSRKVRLESGIDLSRANLAKAELDLQRTSIAAPFNGVIVRDMVQESDFVRAGDQLFSFEDTSKVEVQCNLRKEQLERLLRFKSADSRFDIDRNVSAYELPPTPVKIRAEVAGESVVWQGVLARYDGIGLDERTRMVPCRVVVDNPVVSGDRRNFALVRNMMVDVRIELDPVPEENESLIELPEIALQPGGFVWTVVDGKLKRVSIEVLERPNPHAEPEERLIIAKTDSSELSAGSLIVISPLGQPHPGGEVRIQEAVLSDGQATANREEGNAAAADAAGSGATTEENKSGAPPASTTASEGKASQS
jgi:multidrug efflux pump subunit AcrA (membrane-fusion protein)